MRGAAVVLLVAPACSSDGHVDVVLSGVDIDEDSIVLVAGCFEEAGGDAELRDGQIVVTSLWGEGSIDGDCATGVPLDLAPGPDVVDVEGGKRFALVGEVYRQIDYCGVETQRCVPFSAEPVPADCSLESLRFATVGMFAGVYPIEVVRCEGRWALVDIETCRGFHGEESAFCSGGAERVLLAASDGRWAATGFEAELFCPHPAESFGADDLPDWVCDP
jgi:hypothetical protein